MPRIAHIAIKVDNLEKATMFYEEVFGFAKPARCGLVDVPPKLLAKVEATDASAMISRVLI
jgi:catechol 2,3-dioxygenase-like lactoylglutathione lyase family enzyme